MHLDNIDWVVAGKELAKWYEVDEILFDFTSLEHKVVLHMFKLGDGGLRRVGKVSSWHPDCLRKFIDRNLKQQTPIDENV